MENLISCNEHGNYLGEEIYHSKDIPCPACEQIKNSLYEEIKEEVRGKIIEELDQIITINLSDYL